MNAQAEALRELGASTAAAAADALAVYVGEGIAVGAPQILDADAHPLTGAAFPAVAVDVQYVDGVTGGNVFVMPPSGARALADAMLGQETAADASEDAELDEMQQSAIGEAMNQMMAAAAAATSAVLGTDVDIAPPRHRRLASAADADGELELAPHVVTIPMVVAGAPCRLVQLVPNAFVVRLTRAMDERGAEIESASAEDPGAPGAARATTAGERLREVGVDVWVELGRTRMPAGQLVTTPTGGVLALDRLADDPVDLYVGGLRFGRGRLVVVDGSEWALRVEELHGLPDDALVPAATGAAAHPASPTDNHPPEGA